MRTLKKIVKKNDKTFPLMLHATTTFYTDDFKNEIDLNKDPNDYALIKGMHYELRHMLENTLSADEYKKLAKFSWDKRREDGGDLRQGSGNMYLTTLLSDAVAYLNTCAQSGAGEAFKELVDNYTILAQKTGIKYRFSDPKANEIWDRLYDKDNLCVRAEIKPALIVFYDVPAQNVIPECGDGKILEDIRTDFMRMTIKIAADYSLNINKVIDSADSARRKVIDSADIADIEGNMFVSLPDYILSENRSAGQKISYLYTGPVIPRENYDIIILDKDKVRSKPRTPERKAAIGYVYTELSNVIDFEPCYIRRSDDKFPFQISARSSLFRPEYEKSLMPDLSVSLGKIRNMFNYLYDAFKAKNIDDDSVRFFEEYRQSKLDAEISNICQQKELDVIAGFADINSIEYSLRMVLLSKTLRLSSTVKVAGVDVLITAYEHYCKITGEDLVFPQDEQSYFETFYDIKEHKSKIVALIMVIYDVPSSCIWARSDKSKGGYDDIRLIFGEEDKEDKSSDVTWSTIEDYFRTYVPCTYKGSDIPREQYDIIELTNEVRDFDDPGLLKWIFYKVRRCWGERQ